MNNLQLYEWGLKTKKKDGKWLLICNNYNIEEHFKQNKILSETNKVITFCRFDSSSKQSYLPTKDIDVYPVIYKNNITDITLLRKLVIDDLYSGFEYWNDPIYYFEFINTVFGMSDGKGLLYGKITKIVLNGVEFPNSNEEIYIQINSIGIGFVLNGEFSQMTMRNLRYSELIVYFDKK